jgi:hypothetical protein
MWAFLSRRFRQYLLLAVGVPIIAYLLDGVGSALEERRGSSSMTKAMRSGGDFLRRRGRGPLARRLRERDPGRTADIQAGRDPDA